jgi:hypothetical protein
MIGSGLIESDCNFVDYSLDLPFLEGCPIPEEACKFLGGYAAHISVCDLIECIFTPCRKNVMTILQLPLSLGRSFARLDWGPTCSYGPDNELGLAISLMIARFESRDKLSYPDDGIMQGRYGIFHCIDRRQFLVLEEIFIVGKATILPGWSEWLAHLQRPPNLSSVSALYCRNSL